MFIQSDIQDHLCADKKNILQMLDEIQRCNYARHGLINLVKEADREYGKK